MLGRRLLIGGAAGESFTVPLPANLSAIYNGKLDPDTTQDLYFASSTNGGTSFTIGNGGSPIISAGGGSWYDDHLAQPCLVATSGGYEIWVSGYDGTNWRTGMWSSSTLSDDPGDWFADAGNPIIGLGSSGAPDDVGAYIPTVQVEGGLRRIWYLGLAGATFSLCYAERSGGTLTKYGEMLPHGGSSTWHEVGVTAIAPHTIGGQKRLFLFGQDAAGDSSAGWASYTDPRVAATYTNQGQILAGPITVADGSYDSCAITSILPYGAQWLVFGTLFGPTGSGNQREISFRATTFDGITIAAPVGEVIPLSTAHPNVESAENPSVVLTP